MRKLATKSLVRVASAALPIALAFQNCGSFVAIAPSSEPKALGLTGRARTSVRGMQTVLGSGLYAAYSASILDSQAWMGGWASSSDVGPDRLYQARIREDGGWESFRPIAFTNPGYPRDSGLIPGFHANDPSVIRHPSQPWLLMYYTALPNQFATNEQMTRRNQVGFATSSDDGATWTDHGAVIQQRNGAPDPSIQGTGAWSPSAVAVGPNEIRVYYHIGSANCLDEACSGGTTLASQVLFTKFDATGWRASETTAARLEDGRPLRATNVDVRFAHGRYWLVGNDLAVRNVVLFHSADGAMWKPFDGQDGLLIDAGPSRILTPAFHSFGETEFRLAFSYGDSSGGVGFTFQEWTFELPKWVPAPAPAPAPAPDLEARRQMAGQAFVDAFASLLQAKANGATGDGLAPFISVCLQAQTNARAWEVEVDAWTCQ